MLLLDRRALSEHVALRFDGNVASIANRWPTDDAPHRSTILRWLSGQTLPRSAEQLLCFAGALDLDPFALWEFPGNRFGTLCARIIEIALRNRWQDLLPALSFVREFLGPTANWPNAAVAERYFGRPWTFEDFEHPADSRRGYFATVRIVPEQTQPANQLWHFAWKDHLPGAIWKPFGFVRLVGKELRLYSYNGLLDRAFLDPPTALAHVQMWFGEGAATFRVASLHGFRLQLEDALPPDSAVVRFSAK
jgi:hypothetical protein